MVGTYILEYYLILVNLLIESFLKCNHVKEGDDLIFTNISMLCERNNISIARLEKECGLGNATIRAWKTSAPSVDKLKRVADYLGVTIDSLISDSTEGTL